MSIIVNIDIEYTDNGIFYGGNSVYGELIIEARSPLVPTEVTVECVGEVRVLRHSLVGNAFGCVPPIYKTGYVLRRRVNGLGHISRESRVSRIPFNFILVRPCPQSLESGRMGHVRYWCQAKLVLGPSKKDRFFISKSFTVLEEVDLSTMFDPSQELGVSRGQSVMPTCLCLNGLGRVEAELTLSKKHYVPGENISAKFTVDNSSRLRVRSVHLLLTQTIGKPKRNEPQVTLIQQPTCGGGCTNCSITRGYSLIAARQEYSGLDPGDTLYMPRARVHIPALPCSSEGLSGRLENSSLPQPPPVPIAYAVVLIAYMGRGPFKDMLVSQSVLIGSIPQLSHDEADSAISASSHTASYVESAIGAAATGDGNQSNGKTTYNTGSVSSLLKFAPTYVYYPTIGLTSNTTAEGDTPRSVKRRSILKRKRPNSSATDTTSMTSSWITQSQTSLATRFETPV